MKEINDFLAAQAIKVVKREHPAVFTVDEASKFYTGIPGGHTKNLFLQNKKKTRYYLLVVQAEKSVDLNGLQRYLGESKLSFGSTEKLEELLRVTPGSVSPFGLLFDTKHAITVLIDRDLWNFNTLHFHPNINTATYEITTADFSKFLSLCTESVLSLAVPTRS